MRTNQPFNVPGARRASGCEPEKKSIKRPANFIVLGLLTLLSVFAGHRVQAQDYALHQSINKSSSERFGVDVNLDGEYAVMGAPDHSTSGGVYLYKRDPLSQQWMQVDVLTETSGASSFDDGFSTAMSGNYVVMGEPGRSGSTASTGRARIFYGGPDNDNWNLDSSTAPVPGGLATGDEYGYAVDIDGTHAILSARSRSGGRGVVYLYTRDITMGTNTWNFSSSFSGSALNNFLGQSVAVDGTLAAAGMHGYDVPASNVGGLRTFEYNGTSWVASSPSIITASDAQTNDWFGYSVDISGDYMVVGAYREDASGISDAGSAYVFHWDGSTWTEEQKLIAPDASVNDYFGYSVSVEGNWMAVGAEGAEKVYIYKFNGSDWVYITTVTHSGSGSDFATACSISSDGTLMVGAPTGTTSSVSVLDSRFYWTGQTNTDYATGTNWARSGVPNVTKNYDIIIVDTASNELSLVNDITAHTVTIGTGKTLDLNGHTLTVDSTFSGSGTLKGSASGSAFRYDCKGCSASLSMDQTTPGTSNHLDSLILDMGGSGTLTLSNAAEVGRKVDLAGNTLVSNGNLTLSASSPTVYGQIDGTGGGTITGNITVEKKLANTTAGWRQIALPVTATIGSLANATLLGTAHADATERNIYRWDATDAGSGIATGWVDVNTASDDNNIGYALYSDNANVGLHDLSTDLSATGAYRTGTASFSLKATDDPNNVGDPDFDGWNLVPNPFAANLDASSGSTFWSALSTYKAVHIWNRSTSQFDAVTQSGVAMHGGNLNSETVIPPFQAFWVKAATDMTLELDESMTNVDGTHTSPFMKNGQKEIFRLFITDIDDYTDQSVMYLDPHATETFDGATDALKMYSLEADAPSLFFRDQGGSAISIKAINQGLLNTTEFPLGLTQKNDGSPVKVYSNQTEWNPNIDAYIRDNRDGSLHALGAKDTLYFQLPAEAEGLLTLLFTSSIGIEETQPEGVLVGMDGTKVFVRTQDEGRSTAYQLFDLSGREVMSGEISLNGEVQEMDIRNFPAGMYLLHLDVQGDQVHKVIRY